jgi:hypothetical protein
MKPVFPEILWGRCPNFSPLFGRREADMTRIDKNALAVAVKNTAKLRVETVGGDKSRPAETVQSCLNRGFNDLGSADGISYILRHAIKYYIGALPITHGSTDEDQVAYWKGAYERMAARNKELSSLLSPSQASVEAMCQATILGEDSYGRPVHLSKREAEVAIAAYLAHSTAALSKAGG